MLNRKNVMLTAFVGECLVLSELFKRFPEGSVEWKGKYGFGGYDITVKGKKVEVKAATFNKQYNIGDMAIYRRKSLIILFVSV